MSGFCYFYGLGSSLTKDHRNNKNVGHHCARFLFVCVTPRRATDHKRSVAKCSNPACEFTHIGPFCATKSSRAKYGSFCNFTALGSQRLTNEAQRSAVIRGEGQKGNSKCKIQNSKLSPSELEGGAAQQRGRLFWKEQKGQKGGFKGFKGSKGFKGPKDFKALKKTLDKKMQRTG